MKEFATTGRKTPRGQTPQQLTAWLAEKRMTIAEWTRREDRKQRYRHNDLLRKRLTLAEIEAGL